MTSMTDNEGQADRAALTDTVARFARTEIAPRVTAWDEADEFPRSLYRRAGHHRARRRLRRGGAGYPRTARRRRLRDRR